MEHTPDPSFLRYLSAKKMVDDRALHPRVWDLLACSLPRSQADRPLRVLEVGMGIGTMLERLLDRRALTCAEYSGIDALEDNVQEARRRLPLYAASLGIQATAPDPQGRLTLQQTDRVISVGFEAIDLAGFLARESGRRRWDLLMANAFLDLIDVPPTLPALLSLLVPGGLFYFTINFDSATAFEPEVDPRLDRQIARLYHQTMDQRLVHGRRSGDSHTGRHLFAQLVRAGATNLDIGASDWIVFPRSGAYQHDEEYFLEFILSTIHSALKDHPELDEREFEQWIAMRREQIDRGELLYLAHQLDYLGRVEA